MTFFNLLRVCLIACVVTAKPNDLISPKESNLVIFTRAFSGLHGSGYYHDIYDYAPNLGNYGLDNDIESVYQTGMWIYYENKNYNDGTGRVYFVHGIELSVDFPKYYSNIASSLRFVGNKYEHNDDTWTIYKGEYFTGMEFYGVTDAASLEYLDLQGSSIIITGRSAWTLYSGWSWTGDRICVYPTSAHDVGSHGEKLDFGIYPTMASIGFKDNAVRSVRKGCWASRVAPQNNNLKYEERSKNGGWGYFDL